MSRYERPEFRSGVRGRRVGTTPDRLRRGGKHEGRVTGCLRKCLWESDELKSGFFVTARNEGEEKKLSGKAVEGKYQQVRTIPERSGWGGGGGFEGLPENAIGLRQGSRRQIRKIEGSRAVGKTWEQ